MKIKITRNGTSVEIGTTIELDGSPEEIKQVLADILDKTKTVEYVPYPYIPYWTNPGPIWIDSGTAGLPDWLKQPVTTITTAKIDEEMIPDTRFSYRFI